MRRAVRVVISLLIVVATAGCGGGDGGGGGAAGDVMTTARDFEFVPDVWTVRAGETFDVTIVNQGSVEHEWVVLESPIENEGEFTEDLVIWEIEAEPGASVIGTATALDEGEYQVVCVIPGHFSAGMEGTLRVVG